MIDLWIETLYRGIFLPENDIFDLCMKVKSILIEENNIRNVSSPVIVCGSLFGQFLDLLKLFNTFGRIPDYNYIFLGCYVDYGCLSVETIELLLSLKLKYPNHITHLRGRHENRKSTVEAGLYNECISKYGNSNTWQFLTDIFDYLNLGALVDNRIFCVHSGLDPQAVTIDQIRAVYRFREMPYEGIIYGLLSNIPDDDTKQWLWHNRRNMVFGADVVDHFTHINNLSLICTTGQHFQDGYKYFFQKKNLLSIWSAPKFNCGLTNLASVFCIEFEGNRIETFCEYSRSKKIKSDNLRFPPLC